MKLFVYETEKDVFVSTFVQAFYETSPRKECGICAADATAGSPADAAAWRRERLHGEAVQAAGGAASLPGLSVSPGTDSAERRAVEVRKLLSNCMAPRLSVVFESDFYYATELNFRIRLVNFLQREWNVMVNCVSHGEKKLNALCQGETMFFENEFLRKGLQLPPPPSWWDKIAAFVQRLRIRIVERVA